MLMGRPVRTTLPLQNSIQKSITDTRGSLIKKQLKQKQFYDRGTRLMTDLEIGDKVYMRKDKIWEKSTVTKIDDTPRSYSVRDDKSGKEYRRNRIELKPVPKDQMQYSFDAYKRKEKQSCSKEISSKDVNEKEKSLNEDKSKVFKTATGTLRESTSFDTASGFSSLNVNKKAASDTDTSLYRTRYGRISRKPDRY